MENKERSQGSPSSSFPRKTPRGVEKGNEHDSLKELYIALRLPIKPRKVVFSKEADLRIRREFLRKITPLIIKAVEEAEALGEEVRTQNPRIKKAFELDEIALYERPYLPIPAESFEEACRVRRRRCSLDVLDILLYDGVMNRAFHKKTYREVAEELNKNKDLRLVMKRKITEPLVRGRLNRMGLPSKQLDTK
jgi:hypothetical protein